MTLICDPNADVFEVWRGRACSSMQLLSLKTRLLVDSSYRDPTFIFPFSLIEMDYYDARLAILISSVVPL